MIVLLMGLWGCQANVSNNTESEQENTPEENVEAESASESEAAAESEPEEDPNNPPIDLNAAYEKIESGMAIAEIQELLGEGETDVSSDTGGLVTASTTWQWNNGGLSSLIVTTQNDKVVGKSTVVSTESVTDAETPPEITINEAYDQVTVGMTLEQLEALLGKGAIGDRREFAGVEDTDYWWIWGEDQGKLTATLKGGTVKGKSREGNTAESENVSSESELSVAEAYEKIQDGATLAQVEGWLGKGHQTSFTQDSGITTSGYAWNWPADRGTLRLTVQNGTVIFKTFVGPEE